MGIGDKLFDLTIGKALEKSGITGAIDSFLTSVLDPKAYAAQAASTASRNSNPREQGHSVGDTLDKVTPEDMDRMNAAMQLRAQESAGQPRINQDKGEISR